MTSGVTQPDNENFAIQSEPGVLPYCERVKAEFSLLAREFHALPPEQREARAKQVFPVLFAYFLEQEGRQGEPESRGPNAFLLHDAHEAIVRDFDNPSFHQQLMAYGMAQEDAAYNESDTPRYFLAVKCSEFNANRQRRRGFDMVEKAKKNQDVDLKKAGMALVEEARATFKNIAGVWEEVDEHGSLARVLYELAQISYDLKEYGRAANLQSQSKNTAAAMGDNVGAIIADIKRCEALLKGKLEPAERLAMELGGHVEALRRIAHETRGARETSWLANGMIHLAEAQHAAGQITEAIATCQAALDDQRFQSTDIHRQLVTGATAYITKWSVG